MDRQEQVKPIRLLEIALKPIQMQNSTKIHYVVSKEEFFRELFKSFLMSIKEKRIAELPSAFMKSIIKRYSIS